MGLFKKKTFEDHIVNLHANILQYMNSCPLQILAVRTVDKQDLGSTVDRITVFYMICIRYYVDKDVNRGLKLLRVRDSNREWIYEFLKTMNITKIDFDTIFDTIVDVISTADAAHDEFSRTVIRYVFFHEIEIAPESLDDYIRNILNPNNNGDYLLLPQLVMRNIEDIYKKSQL